MEWAGWIGLVGGADRNVVALGAGALAHLQELCGPCTVADRAVPLVCLALDSQRPWVVCAGIWCNIAHLLLGYTYGVKGLEHHQH